MLDSKYEFISSYLRAAEAKLVNRDHIDKISRASNLQDALNGILDTDIGRYMEEVPINNFDDLDENLWVYLEKCIAQIESFQFVPDDIRKLLKAYITKYDIHNIKVALYQIHTGKKARMIPLGNIHSSRLLHTLSNAENYQGVIGVLAQCGLMEYITALETGKTEEGTRISVSVEAELSSSYYRTLMNIAKEVKDGFILSKAVGIMLDVTNLQIASRAIVSGMSNQAAINIIGDGYLLPAKTITDLLPLKLADLPGKLENTQYQEILEKLLSTYNRTHSITCIEEIFARHMFVSIRELLSPRSLSPLLVIWYLFLKETELKELRLVLKSKIDNVPLDEIKPYLVNAS